MGVSETNKTSYNLKKRIKPYVFSTVCGCICGLVTVLILSLIMYGLQLDVGLAAVLALPAFGLSCFCAAFICGLILRRGGLKIGVCLAIIFVILCSIGALLAGNFSGDAFFSKLICALLTGCTGGVLGVNR